MNQIKKIFPDLFKYKNILIIVALAGIINSLFKAQISIFLKEIMDASATPDRLKNISKWGIVIALGISISRYFHIYLMNVVSEKVAQDLRHRLQKKFMNLSLKFHNNYATGSGGLLSRILNDIKVIQDGLRMFADFFSAPVLFVFLMYNLFFLDWKLMLWILAVVPFLFSFLKRISRSLRKYVQFGQEQLENLTSTIKESLDGVRIIQSFNLEPTMSNKMRKQADDFIELRKKVHSRIEVMGPVTEFIATLIVLGIIYYFSFQISENKATAGTLIAFITAMLQVNEPIKKFQESYVRIQEMVVSIQRVFSILEEPSEVAASERNLPFPQDWKKIEYKNVTFSYGEAELIKDFNLTIKRGEQIAFIGQSGSGKSTIVNMLPRFYDPTVGEILIDNTNIRDINLTELRRHIGLVSQDVFLFSDTIKKNIWAGDFAKENHAVEKMAQAANAHEFILKQPNTYDTFVGDRGNLLSGGEKQRISIARAMFKDAPILILDEATSALDSASEKEVQKGIEELQKGRTALVIAHRLSTIQNADRIIVMKNGKIVEQGKHQDLLVNKSEYEKFYSLQK